MVAETIDALGGPDILVNNAGAPHGADRTWTWEVPDDAFDEVLQVNTKGVFLMSSAILGHQAPGRIIDIASGAPPTGTPDSEGPTAPRSSRSWGSPRPLPWSWRDTGSP